MEKIIQLHDSDLIGKGAHKATYIYPDSPEKCVKIPYEVPDIDIKKELFYRKVLMMRGKKLAILTDYFGTVKTNKGLGYCFEIVRDENGQVSKSLKEYMTLADSSNETEINDIQKIILQFRKDFLEAKVVTSDMDPENFFVQKNEGKLRIRIIDNIGSPVVIPAIYFIDSMASYHNKKYWNRFCREQKKFFPEIFNESFCLSLRV